MPNAYAVLQDGNVVVEFWTGQVTHAELLAHERRHLSDPSIQAGASVLVDAERAHFGTTAEQVKDLVSLYGQIIGRLKIGRKALLVNRETYDRALILIREVEGYGVRGIIFNSLDIACIWLGLDIDMVRGQLQALKAQLEQADSAVVRRTT
ncbi:MAG: hypothetical protein IT389_01140 [Nitrospira sp.]|nr:hypothetical protein [Nitrospira sp.]